MTTKLIQATPWSRALNAARFTAGKEPIDKEPSDKWKRQMLLAEHSPIRLVEYDFDWDGIRQWVTVHLVRHHVGCEKFISTQREDRNDAITDRDELPQGSLNAMMMSANAQSIMSISRKRLCYKASKETRQAWLMLMDAMTITDPILEEKCAPECVYRGFCPEKDSCGYCDTTAYQERLKRYRKTE